jgi:uncharacterized protein
VTGGQITGSSNDRTGDPGSDEWPYTGLDMAALRMAGWRPTPFRQFVVKLHSRCNLACTYCYVYSMGDSTWRSAPRVASPATLAAVAGRISEHVKRHHLESVDVVFHGGEPLLAGPHVLESAAEAMRRAVPPSCPVRLTVQTNGLLLNEQVLAVLHRHRIRVGVSLDGPAEVNDRHRVYADGRGSYAGVARALQLLRSPDHASLYAGLLCTVDVRSDPVSTYRSLLDLQPPMLDFLLPHGNWTTPPPLRDSRSGDPVYGRWLAAAFDAWIVRPGTRIRFFEQLLDGLLGGHSSSESVGISPVGVLVFDTAGRLEQVDSLRSVRHGAAAVGMDVHTHSLDDALGHPGVVARQIGTAALPDSCLECPVHQVCGAGFYPHRYRAGSGYRNPSVYCPDLLHLIRHIQRRIAAQLSALVRSET